MQAMEEVNSEEVAPESKDSNGKTVALYVHVPFCVAECYYCHYYKQFKQSSASVDEYLEAIDQELNSYKERFGGLEVASIYIGGG